MAIGSDAKVEANQIVDPAASGTSATSSWLVITGGTLELTGSKSEGTLANKMQPGLNADYMESLYTKTNSREYVIWPTNGAAHRSEKLVNFQLTADEAHHLFKTIDGMGNEYEYSVDLDKYEAGETLSVWVPAVLLDYYYRDDLPEDTSFEDMTEAEVLALLQATKYRGGLQDAVIRGQSIQFATLKGYTTGNVEEEGKTWYYYTASTADVEDGTVDEGAAAQTGQWLVFGANTPVTALDGQKLYAFSSEHFGEKNDTTMSETWEREDAPEDDLEDDLDSGASAQTSRTLGGLGSLGTGVFGNHGSTSATASLGEIDAQPNQPEQADPENPESQGGEKAAETPAADEESGGQGALQDTASYAVAGGAKTGDATPLWAACALLAVCGLAAAALHGKNGRKRRATCKH
jgi:hypothetical protein